MPFIMKPEDLSIAFEARRKLECFWYCCPISQLWPVWRLEHYTLDLNIDTVLLARSDNKISLSDLWEAISGIPQRATTDGWNTNWQITIGTRNEIRPSHREEKQVVSPSTLVFVYLGPLSGKLLSLPLFCALNVFVSLLKAKRLEKWPVFCLFCLVLGPNNLKGMKLNSLGLKTDRRWVMKQLATDFKHWNFAHFFKIYHTFHENCISFRLFSIFVKVQLK